MRGPARGDPSSTQRQDSSSSCFTRLSSGDGDLTLPRPISRFAHIPLASFRDGALAKSIIEEALGAATTFQAPFPSSSTSSPSSLSPSSLNGRLSQHPPPVPVDVPPYTGATSSYSYMSNDDDFDSSARRIAALEQALAQERERRDGNLDRWMGGVGDGFVRGTSKRGRVTDDGDRDGGSEELYRRPAGGDGNFQEYR